MSSMKYIKQIAYVLVLIGALNWGVYGVSGYDLVNICAGKIPMIARIIYVVVGLSALYIIINRYRVCACKSCDCCTKEKCTHCATCSVEEKK
jgi:uncharacterized membrane protein YuzA (DUF378 family)